MVVRFAQSIINEWICGYASFFAVKLIHNSKSLSIYATLYTPNLISVRLAPLFFSLASLKESNIPSPLCSVRVMLSRFVKYFF
ncbi:hypothetical protein NB716_003569 [Pantoea ananatis]|nr:hypothetical protein [Pantoea ananatis]